MLNLIQHPWNHAGVEPGIEVAPWTLNQVQGDGRKSGDGRYIAAMPTFSEIADELTFLSGDDRHIALRELGEQLEAMPPALKTDATEVRGCASKVWVYPQLVADGRLHFFADAEAALPKGVIAVILSLVQDKLPMEILGIDIDQKLQPLHLDRFLTKQRTNGIPGMIALIRQTALRYA